MNRSFFFALIGAIMLTTACDGTPPTTDAGPEDSGTADAGSRPDSGPRPDAGPPPDGGPTGCTEGCAFVELALGSDHSCARRENGEVWCWGRNQEGQLGDSRTRHDNCAEVGRDPIDCSGTPEQVRTRTGSAIAILRDAASITAEGGLSTCTLRESGELWCWGLEGIERVIGGTREYRYAAQRVEDFGEISQASDGWVLECMVQGADDQVVCFGYNSSGQLGVGDRTEIRVPDETRPVLGPTGAGSVLTDVIEVSAAAHGGYACARTADNVYCWGTNRYGQLGDGSLSHEVCAIDATDTYDCSTRPVVVGGTDAPLADVSQLTVAAGHACVLGTGATAGTVRCWGDNRAAQLAQPEAMVTSNLPLEVDGLGDVVEIDAGGRMTCARRTDGTVWCWGFNDFGQLGDSIEDHAATCTFGSNTGDCSRAPVQVTGIDDATELAVGFSHACAIRASGEIWCWGYNDNKQLGDNTRTTRFSPVRVLGLPG